MNNRQQKWVSRLQAYDFDIEYVKGKNNVVADALSRRPHLNAITAISTDWKTSILTEYANDAFSSDLIEGKIQDEIYQVKDDLIIYKDRIFITPGSKVKKEILKNLS